MKIGLAAVELDTSIQCRASIDTGVVNEYAERMEAGDEFPPVEVFGSKAKCWIGDGWHRVLAARQRAETAIDAKLNKGGRVDALKYALGANAVHGHRRSNADKRRSVEIALREFPKLSSRALAKMCGVADSFVGDMRPKVQSDSTSEVTGQDGKQYPASGKKEDAEPQESATETGPVNQERPSGVASKLGPPRNGMDFARMAIMDLEQIRDDDEQRAEALSFVREWISERQA